MSSDETEKTPAELLSLPNEVLCYLFTFIPPHDAITKIPLVCKRFSLIIKDAKFWSTRIRNEQSVRMPQCELRHAEYSPQKSFYMIHQQNQRWKDWESQRIITAPGHMATVDSVMLFNKNEKLFCLSGSRDRSIRLWDIQNVGSGENSEENKWTMAQNDTAHSGWIWNVSRNEESEKFYTTSWDSTVKEWSIPDGGALQEMNSVNLGSAVQCVSTSGSPNEVVCTTFARRTAVIDTRSFKIVADHQLHKKAVIGLAVQGDKIFTSSEDRMMMMVDRRMMSKAVLFEYCPKSYKTSLSLQRHQLLTSTSDGKVKLYDANNFNVVQSYTTGEYTRQSQLHIGAHMVMARRKGSRQYRFMVYSPGIRSEERCVSTVLPAEPAKFDYSASRKTLAIGTGDSSIIFCLPALPVQE